VRFGVHRDDIARHFVGRNALAPLQLGLQSFQVLATTVAVAMALLLLVEQFP